ncbi:MAG: VPLPA-CTERM sorting domain-containing protein [Desulfobacterium sp.]|nr:VPLPA-CTERM sorting domain-containing protein [Desulfobacterium sp.]
MKIKAVVLSLIGTFLLTGLAFAGSYAPAAGQPGSTAIHMDDASFVAWATGIDLVRGPADISKPEGALASYGTPDKALGKAVGSSYDVVSLGDGGVATLTFDAPIGNGDGDDFAVFENGFSDTFLELGFVEVSSDGDNFFRFDAVSETQTDTQVGGFGSVDTTNLYNLAGKYRQGFGTGFDLDELSGIGGLDIDNIGWVRIIDVVGSINDDYATYDSLGNKVNEPWKTPFGSSGFDLDALGVINQGSPVPVPAAVWLLGSGLVGLVGLRRKNS